MFNRKVVYLRLKFGVARLSILFLLVVLSFVMIGCVPREPVFIEASADGRCTTISLPGLSRSGNGICQREGGDFTVCSAERPPQCTGGSQIWNPGQCSGEQDCTKRFKGVDVVVTCCLPEGAPPPRIIGREGGTDVPTVPEGTLRSCEEQGYLLFDPSLAYEDNGWQCCAGEVVSGSNGFCCTEGLKDKTEIGSELIENEFLGDTAYNYVESAGEPLYVALSGRDPFDEYRQYVGQPTENANEYTFSGLDENNQLVRVTRKLLYCKAQCNVLVGDEVDRAIASGECEGGAAGSILGEPPEGCQIFDFSQDLGTRYFIENGRTGNDACGIGDGVFTTRERIDYPICRKAEIKYSDKIAEVDCNRNIFGMVDPPESIYSFKAMCCAPPETPDFVDCHEEYGEEFTCYTYEQWQDIGSPQPGYEVGCDTGGEASGICAPRVRVEGEFVRSHGTGPECEFENLRWLRPTGEETNSIFGETEIARGQGGKGARIPGDEVILFANVDLDCGEEDEIEFEILEVRARGDFHFAPTGYLKANKILRDGVVWYKLALEWSNWEEIFQDVRNPQFKFRTISNRAKSSEFVSFKSSVLEVLRPAEECGDGILSEGEECDDGNSINNDRCNNACIKTYCGDSIKNGPENCDDGRENGKPNKCNLQCTGITGSVCGNNAKEQGEECDDGNNVNADRCTNNCKLTTCGDGKIQNPNGRNIREECDDEDLDNGDGCSTVCSIEEGWSCIGEPSTCTENPEPCHISNAQWRDESGAELPNGAWVTGTRAEDGYIQGDIVMVSVIGDENCVGKSATFTIYEVGGEDTFVERIPNVIFRDLESEFGDHFIIAYEWYMPKWFKENNFGGFSPDPEYEFGVAAATSEDGILRSEELRVRAPRPTQCNDGNDNDADGLRDLDDPGCWDENGEYDINDDYEGDRTSECQDGFDNDGDNLIDWNGGRNSDGDIVDKDPECCDDPRYNNSCNSRDNSEDRP